MSVVMGDVQVQIPYPSASAYFGIDLRNAVFVRRLTRVEKNETLSPSEAHLQDRLEIALDHTLDQLSILFLGP